MVVEVANKDAKQMDEDDNQQLLLQRKEAYCQSSRLAGMVEWCGTIHHKVPTFFKDANHQITTIKNWFSLDGSVAVVPQPSLFGLCPICDRTEQRHLTSKKR